MGLINFALRRPFTVLVAVMILAILVYRIRETFDSIDVSRLSRLRG